MIENVTNLMTINLIGLPLNSWDTYSSVKKWLRKNHSADDSRVKRKEKDIDHDDNQLDILRYFKTFLLSKRMTLSIIYRPFFRIKQILL